MPSKLAPSESFIDSLPSTISPYLRRISESGPFKQTASAVRFVRRFLGYNKGENQSNPNFTLTYRKPSGDVSGSRKVRTRVHKMSSSTPLPSGSRIFTHGPLGPGDGGTPLEKRPANKTLSTARDKLKETKKTRSSISKKAMKGSRAERPKPLNPFAMEGIVTHLLDSSNAMEVDKKPLPTNSRPSRPLTRSESMLSYSVTSGVTVTNNNNNKRKSSSSELVAQAHRLKRLRISVSFSSLTDDQITVPSVSRESVLSWIRSQPTARDLIAERLKNHFVPSSLPAKLQDKRMKKLVSIVNDVASVIPYKNPGLQQPQHLIVLKDEYQKRMIHPLTGTPLFQYTGMVARLRLNRAMDSMRRKSEAQKLVEHTPSRKMSPLVHEM